MADLKYNVRIARPNGDVEFVMIPKRTAKQRCFRTTVQAEATRYRREEAFRVQGRVASMNLDAVVDFIEAPERTK